MKRLRNRNASLLWPIAALPSMYGDLIPAEESVALWLCAWPRLLGWERSINWLWPGVVDWRKKSRPGLWGVDSIGSLVIVEIRIDRGDAPDPFEDFVRGIKSASRSHDWTADALRAKWLWCSRNSFPRDVRRQLQMGDCSSFAPLIHDDSYQRSVERSLDLRNAVGNPPPVIVGVVASTQWNFRLSQEARKHCALLQKHVGHDRVLLRSISASLNAKGLRIQCRTPESDDAGRSVTTPIY